MATDVTPTDVVSNAVTGTDATEMLVPIAGTARGAGGESFLTDLTIVNLGNRAENITLTWLPLGGSAQPPTRTVTVGSLQFLTLPDVVGITFETSGLGAILIRSANADPGAAALDAHARVYTETNNGGRGGTINQTVPAVLLSGWRNGSPAYVHGTRQNPILRTNYGLVNLESTPRSFRVLVNSIGGRAEETVTVPAFGTLQRPVPLPQPLGGSLSLSFEPVTPAGAWRAYASSIDNLTGSGWTIPAIQPRQDLQR
jgi:hypothetical protein